MRYAEMDHTYVAQAVARIKEALTLVTGFPVMDDPPDPDYEKTIEEPGSRWVVFAPGVNTNDSSSESGSQVWLVTSQLIYRPTQREYYSGIYSDAHVLLPQTFNYFQAHPRLINTDTEEALPYYRPGMSSVGVTNINEAGQPGFYIQHRLHFAINIDMED